MLLVRKIKKFGELDENGVDQRIGSLFCQLSVLNKTKSNERVWIESARWLKFVEVVDASGRWSKPHVATIPSMGLIQLRRLIADGVLILNCQERTLQDLVGRLRFSFFVMLTN